MTSLLLPFRQTYRYLQRQAHESPVIFYSVILGTIGPVMAITIPPIREHFGYRPAEMIPTSYPRVFYEICPWTFAQTFPSS
ncbi:n19m, NADH-ubiquinone oxidoreductase 9.5 kDa subunit [Leucoagaricus gongylophorus]